MYLCVSFVCLSMCPYVSMCAYVCLYVSICVHMCLSVSLCVFFVHKCPYVSIGV